MQNKSRLKEPGKVGRLVVMKKWILCAAVFALLACSCGTTDVSGKTPTEVATTFNGYIFSRKTSPAYAMFSSRIKKMISYTDFDKFATGNLSEKSIEVMDKAKVNYTGETIDGDRAIVYCTVKIEENEGPFRIKLLKENGSWTIDSEILEDQFAKDSSYYRNYDLTSAISQYCDDLSAGKAQGLWVLTSKRIKSSIDLETFKKSTLMTNSGKTPKQEGFEITALGAYADDNGNGIGIINITNKVIGVEEWTKGLAFKMPFVYEDGEWKADFINISKDNIYDPSKEGSQGGQK
jgi:hypothetical protein